MRDLVLELDVGTQTNCYNLLAVFLSIIILIPADSR